MKKILLTFFAFHGFFLQKRNHHKVHYMLMVEKRGKSVKDKVYESCMYRVDMYGGMGGVSLPYCTTTTLLTKLAKKSVANGGRYSKTFHLFYLVK